MKKVVVGVSLILSALATAARADTQVGGWGVTDKPDNGTCMATREYRDADDSNRSNGIALLLAKGQGGSTTLVISLAYEGWEWDKGEKPTADLRIGKQVLFKKAVWQAAEKTVLTGTFTEADTLVDKLGSGETMYLDFDKDSEANFKIPNAGMALGAAKLCMGR